MKKRNLMITAAAATVLLIGGTMVYAAPRNTADPYQKSLSSQPETNESSSIVLVTKAEAEAIALTHAGLKANQVTNLRSEYDWDDRVMYYDIEFRSGDYEYDYEVHAETGVVISWDKDYDKIQSALSTPVIEDQTESKAETNSESKAESKTESKTESKAETKSESKAESKTESKAETNSESKAESKTETKPAASALLTNAEAEAIALAQAGLKADQVTRLKSEYDVDDGIKHYDIEFRSGDYEYDYEVNAETGKVISWDKDYEKSNKTTSGTTNKTESKSESKTESKPETKSESKAESKTETKPAASALLTNAEAEAIALAQAGLKADQVTRLKSEYDVDDGVKQYDIEFRSGKYDYEFEINAETGAVISWDKDFDD